MIQENILIDINQDLPTDYINISTLNEDDQKEIKAQLSIAKKFLLAKLYTICAIIIKNLDKLIIKNSENITPRKKKNIYKIIKKIKSKIPKSEYCLIKPKDQNAKLNFIKKINIIEQKLIHIR